MSDPNPSALALPDLEELCFVAGYSPENTIDIGLFFQHLQRRSTGYSVWDNPISYKHTKPQFSRGTGDVVYLTPNVADVLCALPRATTHIAGARGNPPYMADLWCLDVENTRTRHPAARTHPRAGAETSGDQFLVSPDGATLTARAQRLTSFVRAQAGIMLGSLKLLFYFEEVFEDRLAVTKGANQTLPGKAENVLTKTLMSALSQSPFAQKIDSFFSPDARELEEIRGTLSGPRAQLAQLAEEITQVESALARLREKHASLAAEIRLHTSLLAPIRRIPQDLLQDIRSWNIPRPQIHDMVVYLTPQLVPLPLMLDVLRALPRVTHLRLCSTAGTAGDSDNSWALDMTYSMPALLGVLVKHQLCPVLTDLHMAISQPVSRWQRRRPRKFSPSPGVGPHLYAC
ncbi:hypothetical protein MKEN_00943400 [Mycena kentingensis (nom. inval.)]|nr:hypothetical protein MKEN_00943400 [Mycena kentingensis (nom. inval.)]